jgi:hypothetical protein
LLDFNKKEGAKLNKGGIMKMSDFEIRETGLIKSWDANKDKKVTKEDFRSLAQKALLTREDSNDTPTVNKELYDKVSLFMVKVSDALNQQIIIIDDKGNKSAGRGEVWQSIQNSIDEVIDEEFKKESECKEPYKGKSYGCKE